MIVRANDNIARAYWGIAHTRKNMKIFGNIYQKIVGTLQKKEAVVEILGRAIPYLIENCEIGNRSDVRIKDKSGLILMDVYYKKGHCMVEWYETIENAPDPYKKNHESQKEYEKYNEYHDEISKTQYRKFIIYKAIAIFEEGLEVADRLDIRNTWEKKIRHELDSLKQMTFEE
jgi:hypothetical protein